MTRQAGPQWLTDAITAAEYVWLASFPGERPAGDMIRAALPAIEKGLREQIGQDLEAAADSVINEPSTPRTAAVQWIAVGIRQAASTVRGEL